MNLRNQIKLIGFFIILLLFSSSSNEVNSLSNEVDYRFEMRSFVEKISSYGKSKTNGFIVIPQNGQEIMTLDGEADGLPVESYLKAIDGVGREDLYYGYTGDDIKTPANAIAYMIPYLELAENNDIEVLSIDYCSSEDKMDMSYLKNSEKGFTSFAADSRGLDRIPLYPENPINMNDRNIEDLSQAQNFLYLINPGEYSSRQDMINSISATNYDLIIIDLFDNDGNILKPDEVESLKVKNNGGSRLVLSYMSIGEAEDYRYYWQNKWEINPPVWIEEENPNWKGNYKVRYWEPSWQELILGEEDSYLDLIIEAGFDGVYLDIIDAFEYFE